MWSASPNIWSIINLYDAWDFVSVLRDCWHDWPAAILNYCVLLLFLCGLNICGVGSALHASFWRSSIGMSIRAIWGAFENAYRINGIRRCRDGNRAKRCCVCTGRLLYLLYRLQWVSIGRIRFSWIIWLGANCLSMLRRIWRSSWNIGSSIHVTGSQDRMMCYLLWGDL